MAACRLGLWLREQSVPAWEHNAWSAVGEAPRGVGWGHVRLCARGDVSATSRRAPAACRSFHRGFDGGRAVGMPPVTPLVAETPPTPAAPRACPPARP